MVGSIMVVGALTHYALLPSMYDLKTTQMNVPHSLIQELMPHKFELGHNVKETTKNICCAKGEGTVDHTTITRWFKKFCSGCKNLDDQTRSGRPKTVDSEAMLQAIEVIPTSNTQSIKWACHLSSVWFVTFTTLAKASGAVELYLMLPQNIAKLLTHSSSWLFVSQRTVKQKLWIKFYIW